MTLQSFTVRLTVYNQEQISHELSDQLSDVLVTLIQIFALSMKAMKGGLLGRFRKFGSNVLLGNDDAIRGAVGKLQKLTQKEFGLVVAETSTEVKRGGRVIDGMSITLASVSLSTEDMHEEVTTIRQLFEESRSEARDDKENSHKDKLKNILQPSTTATVRYNKINRLRIRGTGDWIREEVFFKSWIEKSIPILWVSGNPGAGKSYLSSNIIAFLSDQFPQGVQHPAQISVGYFFFKDDNPKTRSFHQALRDMAYQICQNDPIYAKYVASRCDSLEDIETLEGAWDILFAEFFIRREDTGSSVFLIIDGVDEAYSEEREIFLSCVKDITDGMYHPTIY